MVVEADDLKISINPPTRASFSAFLSPPLLLLLLFTALSEGSEGSMQKRWHGAELGQRGYLAELGQRGYLNSPSYLSTFSPFFLPIFFSTERTVQRS